MKYLFITFLFVFVSCKKHVENEQTILFRALNPSTDFRIQGVKVTIHENYHKKNLVFGFEDLPYRSEIIFEGYTNSNGELEYKFLPLDMIGKNQVRYEVTYDYTSIQVPYDDYQVLMTHEGELHFPYPDNYQEQIIRIAPTLNVIDHIKNVNCQGPADTVRYKYWPSYAFFSSSYWNWEWGCIDDVSSSRTLPQDSIFWEAVVIRNGVTTYIKDSMLLDPTKTQDTIKIYY